MSKREGLKPEQCKAGTFVFYSPTPGYAFGAVVVVDPPRELGGGTWVTRLEGLPLAYGAYRGDGRRTVPAAALFALRIAPTEYVDGRWIVPEAEGPEAQGFVIYGSGVRGLWRCQLSAQHGGECWNENHSEVLARRAPAIIDRIKGEMVQLDARGLDPREPIGPECITIQASCRDCERRRMTGVTGPCAQCHGHSNVIEPCRFCGGGTGTKEGGGR